MSDRPITIIAEAGVNHNGSLERALALVDAAAEAGAGMVKFQTFKATSLASRKAPKAAYQSRNTGAESTQLEMLQALELSEAAHVAIIAHCARRRIAFLSTPFDPASLTLLAGRFGLPVLKLGSGELTNGPLLLQAARTGRKLIVSTGMGSLEEVRQALGVLAFGLAGKGPPGMQAFAAAFGSAEGQAALREHVTLLHCTTEYPAPLADINLRAMDTLRETFGLATGYSDHSEGIAIAIAAAARGATVIEKHFTLDSTLPGPDHQASIEPGGLRTMVSSIRAVEIALGDGLKAARPCEAANMAVARKTLVAARDLAKGHRLTAADIDVLRAGAGPSPMRYWDMIGTQTRRAVQAGEALEP